MPTDAIELKCPCCGERLSVDPATGKALALGKAPKPSDLGAVVERVEARPDKLSNQFEAALAAERRRKQDLDDAFRRAAQKAGGAASEPEAGDRDRWR